MPGITTFGEVSDLIGVQSWRLDTAYKRGVLPCEVQKVGRVRVVPTESLGAIRDALAKGGYLRQAPLAVA